MNSSQAVSVVTVKQPVIFARWAVSSIFLLNGFGIANWVVRIPDVSQRLTLSPGTLGLVLLAPAIGALLSMPIAGRLCHQFGSKQSTILYGFAFALVVALPAFASSIILLVLALFVWGAFNGGLDVSMNTQGTTVETGFGRPVLSGFHAMWSVGSLLGAAIGGVFAHLAISPQVHLAIISAFILIAFFFISRYFLPEDLSEETGSKSKLNLTTGLLALGGIAFCALLGEGAIGDWGALYLKNTLGADAGLAASGYASSQFSMAALRFLGDGFRLRFGDARVVLFSGLVAALGVALALGVGQIWAALIGFGLVGAGFAIIFPAALGLVSKLEKGSSGPAIAWVGSVGYTGFLVGPPLIGLIADATSLRLALAAVLLAGLAIASLSQVVSVLKAKTV